MDLTSLPSILGLSIILSQLISNVPLVALYLPLVSEADGSLTGILALAVGSTIAGNLMILAAASNVMITSGRSRKVTPCVSGLLLGSECR